MKLQSLDSGIEEYSSHELRINKYSQISENDEFKNLASPVSNQFNPDEKDNKFKKKAEQIIFKFNTIDEDVEDDEAAPTTDIKVAAFRTLLSLTKENFMLLNDLIRTPYGTIEFEFRSLYGLVLSLEIGNSEFNYYLTDIKGDTLMISGETENIQNFFYSLNLDIKKLNPKNVN